ncbi:hypothetical protein EJB05_24836 [Eragrostis curvula]|uniref:Uncharacterized protein n=1 Tax=Eragrostis curvula TaxID=38414 RepID=A0A5J9VAT1_9POAL|nr:hypothetical protein EJB05_24836 [Eragrostis curvula]
MPPPCSRPSAAVFLLPPCHEAPSPCLPLADSKIAPSCRRCVSLLPRDLVQQRWSPVAQEKPSAVREVAGKGVR